MLHLYPHRTSITMPNIVKIKIIVVVRVISWKSIHSLRQSFSLSNYRRRVTTVRFLVFAQKYLLGESCIARDTFERTSIGSFWNIFNNTCYHMCWNFMKNIFSPACMDSLCFCRRVFRSKLSPQSEHSNGRFTILMTAVIGRDEKFPARTYFYEPGHGLLNHVWKCTHFHKLGIGKVLRFCPLNNVETPPKKQTWFTRMDGFSVTFYTWLMSKSFAAFFTLEWTLFLSIWKLI